MRTKRHADTGSDHSLVVAVLALKLRRAKLGEKRLKRFNVARLTDPDIKQKFNIALKNSYSVLQNETEMTIRAFNQVIQEAGDIILGYQKTHKEEWISQLTWKAIEDRKQIKKCVLDAKSPTLKEKISKEYADKDKEVKNRARNDKRHFIDGLSIEAEEAAGRQLATRHEDALLNHKALEW